MTGWRRYSAPPRRPWRGSERGAGERAGIIIFTFNPHLTANSLLLTVLADLYFLFGAFIEERRFVEIFGDQYREYRSRVPRLVPRIRRRISR